MYGTTGGVIEPLKKEWASLVVRVVGGDRGSAFESTGGDDGDVDDVDMMTGDELVMNSSCSCHLSDNNDVSIEFRLVFKMLKNLIINN